jgi:hypothetical protein
MSSGTVRSATLCFGRRRRHGLLAGMVLASVLALAVVTPASAAPSATVTLAPIGSGSGSYLLTLRNTGPEAIERFAFAVGEANNPHPASTPTNILPVTCTWNTPSAEAINCTAVATGATADVCYTGEAARSPAYLDFLTSVTITTAPAVSSCPLPGFKGSTGKSATGSHAWTHAKCKSSYKAWAKKHGHATRAQKKAEANKLHKLYSCPLSILK